jgi:hypothetical protein
MLPEEILFNMIFRYYENKNDNEYNELIEQNEQLWNALHMLVAKTRGTQETVHPGIFKHYEKLCNAYSQIAVQFHPDMTPRND